ncbi:HNH endonuclease family protein [Candidatus Saccharibacteria bacterium]|nr:HNH endonuclease family protein [Candidatus Saccharibacteria bacterium]
MPSLSTTRPKRVNPKNRRAVAFFALLLGVASLIFANIPQASHTNETPEAHAEQDETPANQTPIDPNTPRAIDKLDEIEIKGRAPRTGYSRSEFGSGWGQLGGCDVRNVILFRDLTNIEMRDSCVIATGTLTCPYTGKVIEFDRSANASAVQIDHVIALSDAWQKGAQGWTRERRIEFSNDPLNLLAVDGPANQQKGDSDAASWLPPLKSFRCQFVARMISVKIRYSLWNTQAETDAMRRVLETCPNEPILLE